LTPEYQDVFNKVLKFARTFASEKTKNTGFQQLRYYAALTLLRGIMSSPASGASMLNNRADRKLRELSENPDASSQYLIEQNSNTEGDFVPSQYFDETDFSENEIGLLRSLGKQLNSVQGLNYDSKAKNALKIIKEWLTNGFNPIVYCRFIDTAKYLGEVLGPELKKIFKTDFDVQVVTSELSDEERKEKVDLLKSVKRKVIFATDCMSEGINLQEQFTGVIHYDLPWNPNRLEQREGRVDRYGQQSPIVKALVLYCKENPVDGTVWNVLLKKTRQIRKDTGIAVPFPEESETILQAVLKSVLLKSDLSSASTQGQHKLLRLEEELRFNRVGAWAPDELAFLAANLNLRNAEIQKTIPRPVKDLDAMRFSMKHGRSTNVRGPRRARGVDGSLSHPQFNNNSSAQFALRRRIQHISNPVLRNTAEVELNKAIKHLGIVEKLLEINALINNGDAG